MSDYRLVGHGRLEWPRARAVADGLTCAWADLDGWHEGTAPVDVPVTTHLWGWSEERWVRMRVDGATAIVGELVHGGDEGEEVAVAVSEGVPWGDDQRIPPRSAAAVAEAVTLLQVAGVRRVTFASRVSPA